MLCLLALGSYRILSKPDISKIERGDLVSYISNGKKFSGRVLGLPEESVLFKGVFYVKSKDKIFSVEENNLPEYKYLLNTENLKANSQKWFTIKGDEIYIIKDEYPQEPEWAGNPNSKIITIRTLDIPGGLVRKEKLLSLKKQTEENNLILKVYQPTADTVNNTPEIDLLFPPAIVNKNKITAIVKINLVNRSLIKSEFLKIDPYSKFFNQENQTDKINYIYFTPSRTNRIKIKLNGDDLITHGFATQPYLACTKQIDTLERTGNDYYNNEEECLEKSRVDLLIFTNLVLKQGGNQLRVIREDTKTSKDYEIEFNSQYSENPSSLPISVDTPIEKRFSVTHNCSSLSFGNVISIPLVKSNNENFYYRLSFPQNRSERGNVSDRLVYFGIDGVLYDLNLPSFLRFNQVITTLTDLDIPLDNLVFKNWQKAKPSQMLKTDNLPYADFYYPGIYFELVPFDRLDKPYPTYVLPWGTINSSGCDG